MKRIYLIFATLVIASVIVVSCSTKKDDPAPSNNGGGNTSCGTPDCYPFRVSKMFLPTGFWGGGDGSGGEVALTFDADSSWINSSASFDVTNTNGWGGCGVLNNNEWATKYYFAPGAKKMTFDMKADAGVKVVLTVFQGVGTVTNKKDSIIGVDANEWVAKTINFTGTYPDSIAGGDFMSISFAPPAGATVGQHYNFAIRNMVISK